MEKGRRGEGGREVGRIELRRGSRMRGYGGSDKDVKMYCVWRE